MGATANSSVMQAISRYLFILQGDSQAGGGGGGGYTE